MTPEEMNKSALEGLAIAEKATEGPWVHRRDVGGRGVDTVSDNVGSDDFIVDEGSNGLRADLDFIADSRTRAPAAYRNVVALCEENERLADKLRDEEGLYAQAIDRADRHRDKEDLREERSRVASLITEIWQAAKHAGIANDVPPDGPNAIQFCRLMAGAVRV